jgi:predicted  nucleic acid-binding Zn-ribbon protein
MAKIINDPEALKSYRATVEQSIEDLTKKLKDTEDAIETVKNEGWDDPKFVQFEKNFSVDKEQIKSLHDVLERYINEVLIPLEDKLKDYGDTDMNV